MRGSGRLCGAIVPDAPGMGLAGGTLGGEPGRHVPGRPTPGVWRLPSGAEAAGSRSRGAHVLHPPGEAGLRGRWARGRAGLAPVRGGRFSHPKAFVCLRMCFHQLQTVFTASRNFPTQVTFPPDHPFSSQLKWAPHTPWRQIIQPDITHRGVVISDTFAAFCSRSNRWDLPRGGGRGREGPLSSA